MNLGVVTTVYVAQRGLVCIAQGILLVFVGCFVAPGAAAQEAGRIFVPGDYATIGAALAAAPDAAVVEVSVGEYHESVVIERPVTLRAAGDGEVVMFGSEMEPVIQILDTSGVIVEGLRIVGGRYGVAVFQSERVTVRSNVITSSRLSGVRVRLAAADIVNNVISGAQHPYGGGVAVTNTMQWSESRVIGNTIRENARSGIITNMTGLVTIQGNYIADNGHRGIAITEMSHARVVDNIVERNAETGIQVVDWSWAVVCNNTVVDTLMAGPSDSPRYGNGITIDYYSDVALAENLVQNSSRHGISVLYGSLVDLDHNVLVDNSALPIYVDSGEVIPRREGGATTQACEEIPSGGGH